MKIYNKIQKNFLLKKNILKKLKRLLLDMKKNQNMKQNIKKVIN